MTLREIIEKHAQNGVIFKDPSNVYVEESVQLGAGAVLYPGVVLEGDTRVGAETVLRSGCFLQDTVVGKGCNLIYVVANKAVIEDNVSIGPFVNLRPDTHIHAGCKIGDFVEIKNSNVDEGTKIPHLSYVGDADVGKRVNVGCGSVFVNYDGFIKHRTTVGDDVFLGCQTNLVAPVCVGNDAFTAAGSTITRNVPNGCFAIARARQDNKEGWVEKYRAIKKAQKAELQAQKAESEKEKK